MYTVPLILIAVIWPSNQYNLFLALSSSSHCLWTPYMNSTIVWTTSSVLWHLRSFTFSFPTTFSLEPTKVPLDTLIIPFKGDIVLYSAKGHLHFHSLALVPHLLEFFNLTKTADPQIPSSSLPSILLFPLGQVWMKSLVHHYDHSQPPLSLQ